MSPGVLEIANDSKVDQGSHSLLVLEGGHVHREGLVVHERREPEAGDTLEHLGAGFKDGALQLESVLLYGFR